MDIASRRTAPPFGPREGTLVAALLAAWACESRPPQPPSPPVALALGRESSFARLADGTVLTWGTDLASVNAAGGFARASTVPLSAALLSGFGQVTVGEAHACALDNNGAPRCWGANESGQLGDGTTAPRPLPTLVPGLVDARELAAGWTHTCARRSDATVWCWGRNDAGQLGESPLLAERCGGEVGTGGTPVPCRRRPALVAGVTDAAQLAAGAGSTCARRSDGAVWCWGRNDAGQLGDGTIGAPRAQPMPVVSLAGATHVALGDAHACALLTDGTVRCWGRNDAAQLGDGTTTNRPLPVPVASLAGAIAIALGAAHTCALLADGAVRCWGDNRFGQLGDGTTAPRLAPVAPAGLTDVVELRAGFEHTCARLREGTVRCWGRNARGQVGDGSQTDRYAPVVVSGFVAVASDASTR